MLKRRARRRRTRRGSRRRRHDQGQGPPPQPPQQPQNDNRNDGAAMMPRGMAGRSFYATRGRRIATFFSQKLEPLFQAEGMTEQSADAPTALPWTQHEPQRSHRQLRRPSELLVNKKDSSKPLHHQAQDAHTTTTGTETKENYKPVAEGVGARGPWPTMEKFFVWGPKIVRGTLVKMGDFGGRFPPNGDLPATGLENHPGTNTAPHHQARHGGSSADENRKMDASQSAEYDGMRPTALPWTQHEPQRSHRQLRRPSEESGGHRLLPRSGPGRTRGVGQVLCESPRDSERTATRMKSRTASNSQTARSRTRS